VKGNASPGLVGGDADPTTDLLSTGISEKLSVFVGQSLRLPTRHWVR